MAIKAEEGTCVLCGRTDQNLKSDHLRECYKISQDKLCKSHYTPKLYWFEKNKLHSGRNIICTNRKNCRKF